MREKEVGFYEVYNKVKVFLLELMSILVSWNDNYSSAYNDDQFSSSNNNEIGIIRTHVKGFMLTKSQFSSS